MPPIRLGRKKAVRNTLVPRIPFVRAMAIANATMLMISMVTTVNSVVYQSEWRKVVSTLPFTTKILV